MKIVYLDAATMGNSSLAPIEALGELVCWPNSSAQQALERVGDCNVLIVNKVRVTKELLDAAPELKLVCEAATGVNNIDLKACEERGIPVRNVAGYSTESVVQETFMHILSLLGNGPYFDNVVKSGAYSASGLFTDVSRPFIEMHGKAYRHNRNGNDRQQGGESSRGVRNGSGVLLHVRNRALQGISEHKPKGVDENLRCDIHSCTI